MNELFSKTVEWVALAFFAITGWTLKRIVSIDKTYLSRAEHAAICKQSDERVTKALEQFEEKLTANHEESRQHRHRMNNEMQNISLAVTRLATQMEERTTRRGARRK